MELVRVQEVFCKVLNLTKKLSDVKNYYLYNEIYINFNYSTNKKHFVSAMQGKNNNKLIILFYFINDVKDYLNHDNYLNLD